jgi:hypothetical protein
MATNLAGIISVHGPGQIVRLMLRQGDPEGRRRLLKGRASTFQYLGLGVLDPAPMAYERNGGKHLGKAQYGNTASSWHQIKVVVPELWPSGKRLRGIGFSINKPWNNTDLCELAGVLDRTGLQWLGFYDFRNAWLMKRPLGVFQAGMLRADAGPSS